MILLMLTMLAQAAVYLDGPDYQELHLLGWHSLEGAELSSNMFTRTTRYWLQR